MSVSAVASSVSVETLFATGGVGGAPIVSTIVPVPDAVARPAPTALDRMTWNVRLGLAVVSGMIGTEIVWLTVPGLKVSVPEVAV